MVINLFIIWLTVSIEEKKDYSSGSRQFTSGDACVYRFIHCLKPRAKTTQSVNFTTTTYSVKNTFFTGKMIVTASKRYFFLHFYGTVMHQSIPTVPIPPPGSRGAFVHVVSPGAGAFAILSRPRGLGISMPRSDPRAFDTRVFESQISLSGRPRPLSKTGLSIRDYCEHDYFVNTTILHFAFKTSPAIFKFMKVELKY